MSSQLLWIVGFYLADYNELSFEWIPYLLYEITPQSIAQCHFKLWAFNVGLFTWKVLLSNFQIESSILCLQKVHKIAILNQKYKFLHNSKLEPYMYKISRWDDLDIGQGPCPSVDWLGQISPWTFNIGGSIRTLWILVQACHGDPSTSRNQVSTLTE